MKPAWIAFVLTSAVLLLALAAGAVWLHSGPALHWAIAELETRTHGHVTVRQTEGSLAGPLTLHGVRIELASVEIGVDRLALDWNPAALFTNRVRVTRLEADGVAIRLKPRPGGMALPLHLPPMPHLPVAIVVAELHVHHASLYSPAWSAPVKLDELAAAARLDNRSLAISGLAAHGPGVDLRGGFELSPHSDYTLDTALDWTWQIPGWAPLAGHTEAHGDLHKLMLTQTLARPYSIAGNAVLTDLTTVPAWSGEVRAMRLQPDRIHQGAPAFPANAVLSFRGTAQSTRLGGTAALHLPDGDTVEARLETDMRPAALHLHHLTARLAKTGARLELKGDWGWRSDAPVSITGNWQDVAFPLPQAMPWASPSGGLQLQRDAGLWQLRLQGDLQPGGHFTAQLATEQAHDISDWTARANVTGLVLAPPPARPQLKPLLPSGNWTLSAHGDAAALHLDALSGHWLGGSVLAQADYVPGVLPRWHARLGVHGLDTASADARWPGKLDADLIAVGTLDSQRRVEVRLDRLHGKLRGAPLDAAGHLRITKGSLQTLDADATFGADRLHLAGSFSGTAQLDWTLDAPDMAQLWPEASGTLQSRGHLQLGTPAPAVGFSLDAKQLSFHSYHANGVQADVHFDGTGHDGTAKIAANDVSLPGVAFSHLEATANGSLAHQTLRIDSRSDRGDAHLSGTGSLGPKTWNIILDRVDLSPTGAGEWQAAAPWSLAVTAHSATLADACLVQAPARICASAGWQPRNWQTAADITGVPLADLQAWLPAGLIYSGSVDASGRASEKAGQRRFDFKASLSPGAIRNVIKGRDVTLIAYQSGTVEMHSNPRFTTGHLAWALNDGGNMQIDTRITRGDSPALSGRLRGEIHDFDIVPALLPQVSSLDGTLSLDVGLAGTPDAPQFDGQATLSDGTLTVPRLGLHVTDLLMHFQGDGARLTLDGSARSGDGTLAWSGQASQSGGVWQAQAHLQGGDFRAVEIPEATVAISPDLNLSVNGRDVNLQGSVTIPHAQLQPRNLAGTAQISPDQVIVGAEGGPPETRWLIHTQVSVVMGDDVHFDGFGLTGSVHGEVLAVDEPGHVTTGSGELSIDSGKYAAYGQNLEIERGRLLFNGGPISDPALDIRAVRAQPEAVLAQTGAATEQKVGVIVRGSLHQPNVSLFADPPLPQGQMMNYLLFGTTGVESDQSQVAATAQTRNTQQEQLVYSGGAFLANQVGQRIGLSDVSIQNVNTANGQQAASLFLGKYLSPRLYVSYGVGIQDPITTVRVIYKLSTKWLLQAQSGSANSADIIYTLEH